MSKNNMIDNIFYIIRVDSKHFQGINTKVRDCGELLEHGLKLTPFITKKYEGTREIYFTIGFNNFKNNDNIFLEMYNWNWKENTNSLPQITKISEKDGFEITRYKPILCWIVKLHQLFYQGLDEETYQYNLEYDNIINKDTNNLVSTAELKARIDIGKVNCFDLTVPDSDEFIVDKMILFIELLGILHIDHMERKDWVEDPIIKHNFKKAQNILNGMVISNILNEIELRDLNCCIDGDKGGKFRCVATDDSSGSSGGGKSKKGLRSSTRRPSRRSARRSSRRSARRSVKRSTKRSARRSTRRTPKKLKEGKRRTPIKLKV